jgi:hypothetical protein
MYRLGDGEFPVQPAEHIDNYLSITDLKRLLRLRFNIIESRSLLPVAGWRGILRLVNSYKLNAALKRIVSSQSLDNLKERAGFGYQLLIHSHKRKVNPR